jgi:hypothetical protein
MEYSLMNKADVAKWLPTIQSYKVSIRATSENGFLTNYLKNGSNILNEQSDQPQYTWKKKRDLFLKRTIAAFKKKETIRRYLSLIAWAHEPEINNDVLKSEVLTLKNMLKK